MWNSTSIRKKILCNVRRNGISFSEIFHRGSVEMNHIPEGINTEYFLAENIIEDGDCLADRFDEQLERKGPFDRSCQTNVKRTNNALDFRELG